MKPLSWHCDSVLWYPRLKSSYEAHTVAGSLAAPSSLSARRPDVTAKSTAAAVPSKPPGSHMSAGRRPRADRSRGTASPASSSGGLGGRRPCFALSALVPASCASAYAASRAALCRRARSPPQLQTNAWSKKRSKKNATEWACGRLLKERHAHPARQRQPKQLRTHSRMLLAARHCVQPCVGPWGRDQLQMCL